MRKQFITRQDPIGSRVVKKLKEIINILEHIPPESLAPGLFTGCAGISLLFFYYSRYTKKEIYAKKGMIFLSYALNNIPRYFNHSYCGGISGICESINHLVYNQFISRSNLLILDKFHYCPLKNGRLKVK